MSNLRGNLKSSGYDSEEAYFYKRDLELIEKLREENKPERKLTVVEGGKEENQNQKPLPRGQMKKAA